MDVVTTAAGTQQAFAPGTSSQPAQQEDEVTTAVTQSIVESLDDADRTPTVRPAEERAETSAETQTQPEPQPETRVETVESQPAPVEDQFRGREVDVVA